MIDMPEDIGVGVADAVGRLIAHATIIKRERECDESTLVDALQSGAAFLKHNSFSGHFGWAEARRVMVQACKYVLADLGEQP
jgi:hypothetical protein